MEIYIVMYKRYSTCTNLPVKAFEKEASAIQYKDELNTIDLDNDVFYSVEKSNP